MTVLKLAPVEFRTDESGVGVLFSVDWKRPAGRTQRLYLAINGEDDLKDALEYLRVKFNPRAVEYQPSLFHTWDWESKLEKLLREYFLQR